MGIFNFFKKKRNSGGYVYSGSAFNFSDKYKKKKYSLAQTEMVGRIQTARAMGRKNRVKFLKKFSKEHPGSTQVPNW